IGVLKTRLKHNKKSQATEHQQKHNKNNPKNKKNTPKTQNTGVSRKITQAKYAK
ncbi:hypothetical protein HMPREF1576_01095, partial [Gardnerella pickettii JCP7719]